MPWVRRACCPHDKKAEDGFLISGWRLVRVGGEIRFGNTTWQSNELKSLEGLYVLVEHTHGLDISAQCWPNGLTMPVPFHECIQLRSIK